MKIKKSTLFLIPFIILSNFAGCRSNAPVNESSQSAAINETVAVPENITIPKISYDQSKRFSDEYRSSQYYTKLMAALQKNKDTPFMQRVLDIALSQEGYLAYSLEDMDIEQARADGNLWTGATARDGTHMTGNTEYTRWFEEYILDSYPYIDCEWCSIFVSWCLYQAGYHSDTDSDAVLYYSYCADPRKESSDKLLQSFNLDQNNVWYTPIANTKLELSRDFNTPINTNIDPYDISYTPGGLVFFSWNGSGDFFDHIGIVTDYDPNEHILTYIGGNDYSSVMINSMDFDADTFDEQPVVKNSERIMAYAEYTAPDPTSEWYRDEYQSPLTYFYDENGIRHWYYHERYYL